MFGIFSNEPWDNWFSLPEPGPWWDGLTKALREIAVPILGFVAPGALGWGGYAFFSGKPILFGMFLFGITGAISLYGFLTFVEMWRATWRKWRHRRAQKEKLRIGPPF